MTAVLIPQKRTPGLNGNGVSLLRRNAIDIHRAFSELHPVIQRTRMLSLNAVVASARSGSTGDSFGIIANELNGVANELSKLITEMEGLFHTVVGHVARTVQAENRARLFRRGLARLHEDSARKDVPKAADGQESGNAQNLERQIACSDQDYLSGLHEVEGLTHELTKRINRINWVAVRQSHITAVSAQIEAARAGTGSGLREVARIVRDLAIQIAETESIAKEKIEDLETMAMHVVAPLWAAANHHRVARVA